MERKDPKDMTASELLRWAAKNVDSDANYAAQAIEIICDVVGSERTHTYEGSMANALEAVADKIDAANCTLFGDLLDSSIKLHGYPSRCEGERFDRWLERCFILRPLDEKGEPVQFGHEDIDWESLGEYRGQGIQWDASAVDARGHILATTADPYKIVAVAKTDENGRVKRRAPEALGADGLPIKVGETAWDMASGLEIVVSRIAKDEDGNVIVCANGDICELQFAPKNITHTPPDTQERIDADAMKRVDDYWGCVGVLCEDCPVKIDGKTPKQRYNVPDCATVKLLELLRRQRELDSRKGGAK